MVDTTSQQAAACSEEVWSGLESRVLSASRSVAASSWAATTQLEYLESELVEYNYHNVLSYMLRMADIDG
jgi:hypothetical protein